MLFSLENVTFSYGDNLILNGVSFSLNEGERVGLVGENGAGKTTLLKLALGELFPDGGKITLKNGVKIGYLAQNGGFTSKNTVYEEMKEVFREDVAAVRKMDELSGDLSKYDYQSAEYARIAEHFDRLTDLLFVRDSYDIDVKIKTVLNGMGFADKYNSVIENMSGGEKTRLKLARLLLEEPDLLILDEPTNHLDISTLFWLEDYMSSFGGAILVVSHDRYFLDKLCTKIAELENGKILTFNGNYTKYKQLKSEYSARLLKEYERAVEERARLQEYVDKNIVRATTAKSAQSRVKQLEKMPLPQKPYVPPRPAKFNFTFEENPAETVLSVENLTLKAGEKLLAGEVNFTVKRGQKVALVGENGTGKTTLLRAISARAMGISFGRFVRFAVYDQEGLNLNPENTVLSELWERHVASSQTEMRSLLARCGLYEEDMQKKVKNLSGGERAKLALAVLQAQNANFLILDEPTNHLDLPARESLEEALKNFGGTILFVSHDRYFISAIADAVLELENGKLNTYAGNYSYYTQIKALETRREKEISESAAQREKERERTESYRSKKERAEEARRREKISRIEREISALEEEESQINGSLALKEVASDYKQVRLLTARLAEIKNLLDALYSDYADMI